MKNIKSLSLNKIEFLVLYIVIFLIIVNAIVNNDAKAALISSICGIVYTFLAGKGQPVCYLFGVTGSGFYSFLAFQNALWGNLLLYAGYYVPMQIIGYFRWRKNLQVDKNEIVKIRLSPKEIISLSLIICILCIVFYFILIHFNDSNPILDSITTVFSIAGMYLTVRRAIEQWIAWMVVNMLSFLMWIDILIKGTKAYSTVIMWGVYLILAIYFYSTWRKELRM